MTNTRKLWTCLEKNTEVLSSVQEKKLWAQYNMRAKLINEKFIQDSDAIHDMGIGEPEYDNLVKAYKRLDDYMNFDVEDFVFADVIKTLNYLRRISAYNVAMYFNRHYNFYVKIDPKNIMGGNFASADLPGTKYKVVFSTSGPGNMVGVAIYTKSGDRPVQTGMRTRSPGTSYSWQAPSYMQGSGKLFMQ